YEALTGKLPFDAKTPMEFIQLHVTKPPIPIDERVPGKTFPPGLWPVLARALAKKPDARYANAADFAQELRPFAGGKTFTVIMPRNDPGPASQPAGAGPIAKTVRMSPDALADVSSAAA